MTIDQAQATSTSATASATVVSTSPQISESSDGQGDVPAAKKMKLALIKEDTDTDDGQQRVVKSPITIEIKNIWTNLIQESLLTFGREMPKTSRCCLQWHVYIYHRVLVACQSNVYSAPLV